MRHIQLSYMYNIDEYLLSLRKIIILSWHQSFLSGLFRLGSDSIEIFPAVLNFVPMFDPDGSVGFRKPDPKDYHGTWIRPIFCSMQTSLLVLDAPVSQSSCWSTMTPKSFERGRAGKKRRPLPIFPQVGWHYLISVQLWGCEVSSPGHTQRSPQLFYFLSLPVQPFYKVSKHWLV